MKRILESIRFSRQNFIGANLEGINKNVFAVILVPIRQRHFDGFLAFPIVKGQSPKENLEQQVTNKPEDEITMYTRSVEKNSQ